MRYLAASLLMAASYLSSVGAIALPNYDVFAKMKLFRPMYEGRVPHVGRWYLKNVKECSSPGKGMTVTEDYVETDGSRRYFATVTMDKRRPTWEITFKPWRKDQTVGDMSLVAELGFDRGPNEILVLDYDEETDFGFTRCPSSQEVSAPSGISLTGIWSRGKPGICVEGRDYRSDQAERYPLEFGDKRFEMYEWFGKITNTKLLPDGSFRITYVGNDEGEEYRGSITVKFLNSDTFAIVQGRARGRYFRCP